ncbi:UNVERIFIED_CONTAM: hypothetical protein FKN15_052724 [Acipenser sinensis]
MANPNGFGNLDLQPNDKSRKRNRPHLYILRGLPGSQKTALAKEIQDQYGSGEIFSTDDYFRDETGYMTNFDRKKLLEAHQWNQERAEKAMKMKTHPVIIDNTNIHLWEMKPYVQLGLKYRYHIRFREPRKNDVDQLYSQTGGRVPVETIEKMKNEFEDVDSIYDVLASKKPQN